MAAEPGAGVSGHGVRGGGAPPAATRGGGAGGRGGVLGDSVIHAGAARWPRGGATACRPAPCSSPRVTRDTCSPGTGMSYLAVRGHLKQCQNNYL